jgi:AraC family transcriptional regulator of adaptative response/methylated-DNA-[protein]-cysteine methyltransferase
VAPPVTPVYIGGMSMTRIADRFTEFSPLSTAAADYDIVRRAIAHIRGNWRAQPEVEEIAHAAGVNAGDLHHLFRRWCG